MKKIVLVGLVVLFCQIALSREPATNVNWDSLKFLLGKWVGEGGSEMGTGSGYFTFEMGLNGKVLIRKNHAEYPATKDRPAFSHDDLMIVYADPATKRLRAFYTDTEGNVINYAVSVSSDSKSVVFLCDQSSVLRDYCIRTIVTE